MSSTATITTYYFHWTVSDSGTFLSILGILMFPANMVVAHLSRTFEDRTMIVGTQCMMLVGTIGIISYSTNYTVFQYIGCYIIIFLGANMLEGPNMALLSKTLPKRWAKGTFNSGLLATEAGTFGRVVGDFVISAAGFVALDRVLDLTFIPTAVLVGVTLLVCCRLYPQLQEIDDEDE
jgi:MFS family permease